MALRNRPFTPSLKASAVYKADREAKLTRLAIETPDCTFLECTDCCFLEREEPRSKIFPRLCPECGGRLTIGIIAKGEIHG